MYPIHHTMLVSDGVVGMLCSQLNEWNDLWLKKRGTV